MLLHRAMYIPTTSRAGSTAEWKSKRSTATAKARQPVRGLPPTSADVIREVKRGNVKLAIAYSETMLRLGL